MVVFWLVVWEVIGREMFKGMDMGYVIASVVMGMLVDGTSNVVVSCGVVLISDGLMGDDFL